MAAAWVADSGNTWAPPSPPSLLLFLLATGAAILAAWEEFKGFASKYQDDLATPDPDSEEIGF